MNSRKRLVLAAVLSTTMLLIGVALLALLTRTPPPDPSPLEQVERSLQPEDESLAQARGLSPDAERPGMRRAPRAPESSTQARELLLDVPPPPGATAPAEQSSEPAGNASARVRSDWELEESLEYAEPQALMFSVEPDDGPAGEHTHAGTLSPQGLDIQGEEDVEVLLKRVVIPSRKAPQALADADMSEPLARSSEIPEAEVWIIAKAAQEDNRTDAEDYSEDEYVDASDPGSGAMVAHMLSDDNQYGTENILLPLQHTAVDAAIAGHISTVRVTQQFANPFDTKIEAVYVFPLPQQAAVSEFLMVIGERTIRGILREKEEAEAIYRAARDQGYQASLLVQRRPNIFEQKVANIEPGKAIDVDITYFNTLAYRDGWYSFVFPTVVGPRFNPPGHPDPVHALPRGGRMATPGAAGVRYLAPTERSGHDLGMTVRINAGVPIEDITSTHDITVDRDGPAAATVQLAQRTTIPNRDFVLDFRVAGEAVKSGLMTYQDPDTGEGFFSLMLIPPLARADIARRPMELVFVIDTSGSMQGRPLAQAKQAVATALGLLNQDDTFQIIRFSDDASQFGREPVPATADNLAAARRYLADLSGDGGTMMVEGIRAALGFPHDPSRYRFVSFMTDGYIGNEADILAEVHRRIGNARIFSFGVGGSVNRYLMERMANVGRGAVAYLGLNDSADAVMEAFFERVSRAALTDVEVDWGGMTVSDTYPGRRPDLFVGRPLVVSGKFRGKPAAVTVSGMVDGARRPFAVEPADAGSAGPSLARVW
ncbi:MAG: VWA domain-containing protein, partial [Gammaproteobacteria bacterium]|nr:VWA domain-containing protein [Gammaproteobacteria bacterium]